MWPLKGTAEGWQLTCFCRHTTTWQEGTWTMSICVFICCLLSEVKEKRFIEEKYGKEGEPVKSLLVVPQLQLQCQSSVWCLRLFTSLFFLLHFMPISLAPVLPVLRSSCWAEAFEGPGHLKVELSTRRVYICKLSQAIGLVASWETGTETSKVEKID